MWYYLKDRADKQNNTDQGKQLRTVALNIFFLFVGILVMCVDLLVVAQVEAWSAVAAAAPASLIMIVRLDT